MQRGRGLDAKTRSPVWMFLHKRLRQRRRLLCQLRATLRWLLNMCSLVWIEVACSLRWNTWLDAWTKALRDLRILLARKQRRIILWSEHRFMRHLRCRVRWLHGMLGRRAFLSEMQGSVSPHKRKWIWEMHLMPYVPWEVCRVLFTWTVHQVWRRLQNRRFLDQRTVSQGMVLRRNKLERNKMAEVWH